MRELGKRIKRRRVLLGVSQTELGKAAGKTHGWVSALEKGEGNPPSEALTAVAVKLGEEPAEYLRLAGRVALTAEGLTPSEPPDWAQEILRRLDDITGRLDLLGEARAGIEEGRLRAEVEAGVDLRPLGRRGGRPPRQPDGTRS